MKKLALLWVILAGISASSGAAEKNIFDDDWVQPKAAQPKSSDAPKPAAKPETPALKPLPPAPTLGPATIVPANPPAKAPLPVELPAKLAVPGKPEQAASRKMMKDLFAKQLLDRTISGRRRLTEALLNQAEKLKDAPVDRYVLLGAAVESASQAASLPLVFKAANRMAQAYEIDALAVKSEAALRVAAKSENAAAADENIKAVLNLTDDLAAAQDFVTAVRLCNFLQPQVTQKPAVRSQVQQLLHDLSIARDAIARGLRDFDRLKAAPNDPGANLSVGRFLCFMRGDWDAGLPMLVKGSDPVLESLAVRELAAPTAVEDVMKLADAWWEVGVRERDLAARGGAMAHAAVIYRRILTGTTGLRRVQIQKRLTEYAINPARPIIGSPLAKVGKAVELLPTLEGQCTRSEQGIVLLAKAQRVTTHDAYKTPVAFHITLQTAGDVHLSYVTDDIAFNSEQKAGAGALKSKGDAGAISTFTWVAIDLMVKGDSMTISVDGQERRLIEADFSKVNQRLTISSASSELMIKSVQMTLLAE